MKNKKSIIYCTSYYRIDYIKAKIKGLRESKNYLKVFAVNYIKDFDESGTMQSYARIRVIEHNA